MFTARKDAPYVCPEKEANQEDKASELGGSLDATDQETGPVQGQEPQARSVEQMGKRVLIN